MPGAFDGRLALVTGAGRGIGAAIAEALAAEGAHVVLTARTGADLEAVEERIHAAGGAATIAPMDLTEQDSIARLAEAVGGRWPALDMLVLNAAMLGTLTPGRADRRQGVQPAADPQPARPAGADRRLRSAAAARSAAGRVVALTSGVGARPRAYWGAYGASKAALETLVLAYGEEVKNLAPLKVAIVNPGATATAMRARAYPGEDAATLKRPERGGGGRRGAARGRFRERTPARGAELGLRQRHLGDVDAAAAEAAFAIHEIVAPQVVEGVVEAGGQAALGDRALVAGAPALQRLGIMKAVALAVVPAEAGLLARGGGNGPRRSACRPGRCRSG